MLSHQPLGQALVELFVNYTKKDTAVSGEDGGALLHVPNLSGLQITVVASKTGFISTLLPYKTNRIPIFSSLTASLLGLNPGNIWLYDDSVLITGKTAEASSQAIVRFPGSLLTLTPSRNITSVKAFVTVPKLLPEQDSSLNTLGIMDNKSGYVSVQLSPVAAVSVQLFSGDTELHVTGPVQISLGVPASCRLQAPEAVPAWFFNQSTGGWIRKGLGKMMLVDGKLMWTFTAPHLGYWMAAPLSSTRGLLGLSTLVDFTSHHLFSLLFVIGGTLLLIICLLTGMLYYCRKQSSENKVRKSPAVIKKDQTTSTCHNEVFGASSEDACHAADGLNQKMTNSGDVIVNPGAVAVSVECHKLDCLTSEQTPSSLTDGMFFYNQPVAILPASAFFHLEEEPEQTEWSKSATLPRMGFSNGSAMEPQRKDSFTQTLQNAPSAAQSQVIEPKDQPGGLEICQAANGTTRGPFPESLSVPGTLNKIRESRHSVHTFTGLSKIPSPLPPRAWFVSLEGKPAAEIRYAVSEHQRRRRPIESRETSLDSGVDMSELSQTSGRRTVTLERDATFVKSTPSHKNTPQK
ncbi:protein FAM171B isoform X2 [Kryptolebias marmoratus]|nr:protein FAM171B isoform X2 [Kryptolebias marmoratus]